MISTNWPNPERPGVPMFPERDGWHWMSNKEEVGLYPCKWVFVPENIYGGFWDCSGKRVFPYIIAGTDNYLEPCLTPTQIAEMLAGERERIAKWIEPQRPHIGATGEEFATACRQLSPESGT